MNKLFKIFCLQTTLVILSAKSVYPIEETEGNLLDNYLPACMQGLAYYIDLLQYEPLSTTTIEPPFNSEDETTTAVPPISTTTEISTTRKSTSSWFQSPSWWSSTTTTLRPLTTRKHKPALYAPFTADQHYNNEANTPSRTVQQKDLTNVEIQGKMRSSLNSLKEENTDYNILNILPYSLTRDIKEELDDQDQLTEVENLDNFLRSYDDKYGTKNSITGKKRIPPTKPYVEFLLIYDLLKRDAKAFNLSKYEGYTDKMVQDLFEISSFSAQRQMYTLLKRMLDRKEIQRSDVVNRVKSLVKELGNGKSVISKSLMFYPPLQFIPI
ncbi:uncharacterized protein LOC129908671 [Episyrphus balteatus]|uniref:uncharacterized protein LOC129908671 n=1 Tax=Episyrphus balteatus TaxID=286459 RepID=UPI0024856908|nr:uncharacterized protein LOC129908671 [Episyrphus balteatus]